MDVEEKYNLAFDIIKRGGFSENKDVVTSIAEGIKNNTFFIEYSQGNIVLFLTWKEDKIEGNKYIFINNLWIEPIYRNSKTLVRLRKIIKYLLCPVHKFYWYNRKKEKLIYRS